MALWQGEKTISDEVSWGEFLQVVITGEYNVPYCLPFSGIDAHPPHAINQTNISAHSCNLSEQLFFKKTSNLAINSLVRNPPRQAKHRGYGTYEGRSKSFATRYIRLKKF